MPRLTAQAALDSMHTACDMLVTAHPFDRVVQTDDSRTLYFDERDSIIKLDATGRHFYIWCSIPASVARRFRRESRYFRFTNLPGFPFGWICVKCVSSGRGVQRLLVYLRELARILFRSARRV